MGKKRNLQNLYVTLQVTRLENSGIYVWTQGTGAGASVHVEGASNNTSLRILLLSIESVLIDFVKGNFTTVECGS